MGAKRLGRRVWAIGSGLPFPINVFLVELGGGLTLVDAGIRPMAGAILRAIGRLGLPLQRVVLTHGHFDHIGGLPAVLRRWPVPVLAHPEEVPFLLGERRYPAMLRWPTKRPSTLRRPAMPAKPLVDPRWLRALDPAEEPAGLQPRHCPGHTPGHTAYWAPDEGLLLAGDLFSAYLPGRLGRPTPSLTTDMAQAVRSGALVTELRPERMALCHGGVVHRPHDLYPAYRRRHLRE